MATGDHIRYSSFSKSVAHSYLAYDNEALTCYVSAPSFYFDIGINSVAFRHAYMYLHIYVWDWNATVPYWKPVDYWTGDCQGAGNYVTWSVYHNYNGSDTFPEYKRYHFWKFVFESTIPGSCHSRFYGYAHGLGGMSEPQFNDIAYGRHLVSAGRLGADHFHAVGNTSGDDATALSYFNWQNNTGTWFDWSYENKVVPRSWVPEENT